MSVLSTSFKFRRLSSILLIPKTIPTNLDCERRILPLSLSFPSLFFSPSNDRDYQRRWHVDARLGLSLWESYRITKSWTPRENDSYITILSKLYLSIRVEFTLRTRCWYKKFMTRVVRHLHRTNFIHCQKRSARFSFASNRVRCYRRTKKIADSINTILLANKRERLPVRNESQRIRATNARIGVSYKISKKINQSFRAYTSFRRKIMLCPLK